MRFAGRISVLTLLALGSLLAHSTSAQAMVQLHSCDLGAARPLRCGQIEVPLRRADPTLGTTEVGFALRPRSDRRRPSLGTIFAVDGGPGYASTAAEYVRSVQAALTPLLRRRDLVFFDERGTGTSGPIDCAPLQQESIQEYIAIGQCAQQLGPSYAAYTSAEAAADLDAVRAALGLPRITLYGDSYGTLFGQAYAVRYASRLRALILDSAYPADDPYYRTLYPAGVRALNTACRRSPICSGNASQRFRRVVKRFHVASRSTEPLLRFLLGAGTFAPRSYLSLDQADRFFLHGDPRRLDRLLAPGPLGHGNPRDFSYGLEPPVPPGWRAPAGLPTLILAGELDDVTSVQEARQVRARFPGSRLYVVPNRGHVSSLYFPFRAPAVGVIRNFVRHH